MDMPAKGRKNMVGSLHGPQNEPNLNATHPALLLAGGFNSDVQMPYRLPVIPATHSSICSENCCALALDADIAYAVQAAQDAQVG